MDYASCRSLPAMFFEVARQRAARRFVWVKRHRRYQQLSWAQAAGSVMHLARGLAALGIEPGDRVALVSGNRPEWSSPIWRLWAPARSRFPPTSPTPSRTTAISSATAEPAPQSCRARRSRPASFRPPRGCRACAVVPMEGVAMEGVGEALVNLDLRSWDDVLALGSEGSDDIAERIAALMPDDTACIIHTSGTGGLPKGVLLTHRNIIRNCRGAYRLLEMRGLDDEVFLSFLPLSHAYEHTAGMMFPISIGAEIFFAEGAETLAHDLLEVRPTMMTAVPRLYETMHQRIRLAIEREGELKRLLFQRAVAIGRKRLAQESLSLGERLVDPALDRLVRDKVRARFGGRLKMMISGGAPLNPEIGGFFVALGVQLLQGYGQTEAAPVICCNPPDRIKIDTVGPPVDGVEVRIAEDGEILVSGDNVMKGYWNAHEETARTLVDGWLHTGDIGCLDAEGYLRITDRKRDFIKNSGSDMISPARVEGALTLNPEIAQAMVFGDLRPYLVAVIVPDPDFTAAYSKERGLPGELAALAREPDFHKTLGNVVVQVNQGLAVAERVRRFIIAGEPFSIANAQLTPTLKIRRHAIREAYQAALEMLYDRKGIAA